MFFVFLWVYQPTPATAKKMHYWVRQNTAGVAIALFVVLYGLLHWLRPAWLYRRDGSMRLFGVGFKERTFLPAWLVAILLGILCYLAVRVYLVL